MSALTLDSLHVLDAIERSGSFAAAAKELFRVPSTISYAVSKLEEDLGVRVFDRAGPRVMLTPAGRALLDEGRPLLLAALQLEHKVRRVRESMCGLDLEKISESSSGFSSDLLGRLQLLKRLWD